MVVRMRHTRSHTANRRSHHALRSPALAKCGECGAMHLPHRVCENCGKYRGNVIIDVVGAAARKAAKMKARHEASHEHAEKEKAEAETK